MDDREMPLWRLIQKARTDDGACEQLRQRMNIEVKDLHGPVAIYWPDGARDPIVARVAYRKSKSGHAEAMRAAIVAVADAAIGKEGK